MYKLDLGASQVVLVVKKNPPANAGDARDTGLIPEPGRSPGGGHGNPLQCYSLENPMDRRAWRATVYRVAESNMIKATQHTGENQILVKWKFSFA